MLKIQKISRVALIIGALFSASVANANVKNESYAIGALFGADLKGLIESQQEVITYNQDQFLAGVKDALDGKVDFQNPEFAQTLQAIDEKAKAVHKAKLAEMAKKVEQENAKLVADFKKKSGVKETKSGLLYRIEKAGSGVTPKATDRVKVHYVGKLGNGEEFDSSIARNMPAEFLLNQVIAGWTEGLQLLKKGGKMEMVIPANLAYGEQSVGRIPANATLYFEVELLDVIPQK